MRTQLRTCRIFAGALLIFASACATARGRVLLNAVDPAAPRMLVGINDGYHSPLQPDVVAHYCEAMRDLVVRSPVLSA